MRGKFRTAQQPIDTTEEGEASVGLIGHALWRHKRSIIGPTLIVAAAAFVAANMMTPKYRSEARVLVEGRENIFLRPEAEKSLTERSLVDQETLTSQVQLVLSRDLARDVIKDLQLAQLPEFDSARHGFSVSKLFNQIGLGRDPASLPLDERVLNAYYDRLSAYAVDKSRVIVIDFESYSPQLAAKITNAIADKYLTLQQIAKQDQARAAGLWLAGEIAKLRTRVAEAEAKVEEFRAKSNQFVGANNTTLSIQQLSDLSSQMSAARATKADAETKSRLIREHLASGRPIEFSEINNSELIRRLSEQRVTLRAQLAEQSSTLLSQHPRIKELRAQIADLDQQIRGEGEKLARSFENDAKVASARLETITANLDQLKRLTASTTDQDVELRALQREAKAQRDLLESYLAKYREATARDSIAAAPPDARIISTATATNVPYFPKKLPIVLIAALATFCLASAIVVTNALLRASPYDGPVVDHEPTTYGLEPEPKLERKQKRAAILPPEPPQHEADHLPPDPPVREADHRSPDLPVYQAEHLPADPPMYQADGLPPDAPIYEADHLVPDALVQEDDHLAPPQLDEAPTVVPAAPDVMIAPAFELQHSETIQSIAARLRDHNDAGRRVVVIGAARNVGTTLSTIALGRALSRDASVVMIDLAFTAPDLQVVSHDPAAPGIADLLRGAASFGDVITRDRGSRAHIVATGAGPEASSMIESLMLAAAFDALAESYDHLVIDGGSQTEIALAPFVHLARYAVLVAGDVPDDAIAALREQMLTIGFSDVAVLTGPPPALEQTPAGVAA
jgi:uncharacterized protein involved in exopolysaccharide biosynthesis